LISTQLPIDHWGEVIGDELILDGFVDQIEPAGLSINFKGAGYRSKLKKIVDEKGLKN
jgi:hypothetical protein